MEQELQPNIQWRVPGKVPAGPKLVQGFLRGEVFRRNAAEALVDNARRYGDLVYFKAFGREVLQFNHPELIGEMLVRDARHHHRNLVMQGTKAVLGHGLLTSEEPLHMRQRRLAQPAFHRERIAAYGEAITHYTQRMTGEWVDGETRDLRADMLLLALRIVGKTLFDTGFDDEIASIAAAVDTFQIFFPLSFLPFPHLLQKLPLPAMKRVWRRRDEMDKLIYGMIAERRADPRDRGDLLSMLIATESAEDAKGGVAAKMSDTQVRDECLTVLLAGHETTANALSFALWLLASHPELQEELAAECRSVLGERVPGAADYPSLALAERVFAEALRLYPPVWVTARTAAESYEYRGFTVRKGTILCAPQFAVHRDPRWWGGTPERFDPMQFSAERKASRPKLAYFPFGGGSRQCIGEGLAWMEGVLILSAMVQHWRILPGASPAGAANSRQRAATMVVSPAISLRPKGPVNLRVERR